jgi:hypothetical protein
VIRRETKTTTSTVKATIKNVLPTNTFWERDFSKQTNRKNITIENKNN